jgi:membrane protein required for colicin V production
MDIAIIDIVFIVIAVVSALRCAARGFISELLSMAALIFGLLSAIFFFRKGALLIREQMMPGAAVLPEIIAFAAIFLIIFVAIKIIEVTLKNIIEGIQLGGLDRLLGLVFGCAEGIIIICLILFLIAIQPLINPELILGKSLFAKILLPFVMGTRKEITESVVLLKIQGGVFTGV